VGVVAYLFVAGEVGFVAFLLLGHSFLLVFGGFGGAGCGCEIDPSCCWVVGVVCLVGWMVRMNVCVVRSKIQRVISNGSIRVRS
jgi:hypothetical protein